MRNEERIILTKFTYWLLAAMLFWPLACKKNVDLLISTPKVESNIEVKLSLPSGVKFKAGEVILTTASGQMPMKDEPINLSDLDPNSLDILIAEVPASGLTLFGIHLKGEYQMDISAASTALALLMINPVTSYLSENDKRRLAAAYRQHALFDKLAKEIESFIIQNKSFLKSNNKVFEVLNQIQGSSLTLKGRQAAQQALTGTHKAIKEPTLIGNQLVLQNDASFLPYFAGIYDESGKEMVILDLQQSRIENTSIDFLFKDAFTTVINWSDCFDYFGSRPIPNCKQEAKFFKPVKPEAVNYQFEKDGVYTIKITNCYGGKPGMDKLLAKAGLRTGLLILTDIMAMGNVKIAQKLAQTEDKCLLGALGNYFVDVVRTGITGYNSRDAYKVISQLISSVVTRSVNIGECLTSEENKYFQEFLKKYNDILQFSKVFEIVGAGANVIGIMIGSEVDQSYYEFRIEVKGGKASISSLTPTGSIATERYCYSSYTEFSNGISSSRTEWGYSFILKLEEEFANYPQKSLYLITADRKYFVPLDFSEANSKASMGYTFSTLNGNFSSAPFPNMYEFDKMYSDLRDHNKMGIGPTENLTKAIVVLSDGHSNYIKSATFDLTQPINTGYATCGTVNGNTQTIVKLFTVPF